MKHKILAVLPFKSEDESFFEYNRKYVFPEGVDICTLPLGQRMNESPVDSAITLMEELKAIKQAEKEGYEAVVVGCFLDPGVREARELVDIPVLGTASTTLQVCTLLGQRIGIITTSIYVKRGIEANLREQQLDKRVVVRYIGGDAISAIHDDGEVVKNAVNIAIQLIEEDDCAVLTLGCGGLYGHLNQIRSELKIRGYEIPIVEGHKITCEVADILSDLGLSQSRLTYPKLGGYEGLE